MTKILVVDDSGLSRRISRGILQEAGHEVIEAEDGMGALEKYFLERPDLVLLDITMKGMTGFEVLKKLLEMDGQARVVIATADIQSSTRTLTQEAGAVGFVTKPVAPDQLIGAVKSALGYRVMELTEPQKDALTELINIAFSRTAASLSELTGNRVDLEVPEVGVHPISELAVALERFVSGEVATVHQVFAGTVAGDALLLLNHEGALQLVNLLISTDPPIKRLAAASKEVLTEVGNILLNACMGVFGDLLHVRFSFTVPRLQLEALGALLDSLVIEKDELHHALVVGAKFHLQASEVSGCLVLVLGVASLNQLMQAVEKWADSSLSQPANRVPKA